MIVKYTNRCKCIMCNQILWTTNTINSVRCKCNTTELFPTYVVGAFDTITTEEFEEAARQEIGLPASEPVTLVKI